MSRDLSTPMISDFMKGFIEKYEHFCRYLDKKSRKMNAPFCNEKTIYSSINMCNSDAYNSRDQGEKK